MYTVDLTQKQLTHWIRSLRSGAYRQGKEFLVVADRNIAYGGPQSNNNVVSRKVSFCCMGVLGHICGFSINNMNRIALLDNLNASDLLGPFDKNNVDERFCAKDKSTHNTLARKLSAMNDNGKSFRQIAAWIQRNVKAKYG